ncbi:MAG: permease prefix domain 1-containing protein [Romboutsia sp.]|uniref:permease prefix domain 1-containing protein n=1 Tax=Romboutsia sp. TaxID=1965302 RepID=UPI003F3FA50C
MDNRIKNYVDELFYDAPKSRKMYEIKEEILSNVIDKYEDLIREGIDENSAFKIAISNIGDIEELIEKNSDIEEKQEIYRKKSGLINAIVTGLYILSPVPIITIQNELGVILLLAIIALATGLSIYNSSLRPKYITVDDDLYKEFVDWKNDTNQDRKVRKEMSSIITSITIIVYFIVSFTFRNWDISWVIFLIGGLVKKIYFVYYDRKNRIKYGGNY